MSIRSYENCRSSLQETTMSSSKLKNIALDFNEDSDDDKDDEKDSSDVLGFLPLEKLNLGQRKKLLVLCLGGLLVDRIHVLREGGAVTRIARPPPDAFVGNFKIYKRPFCDEFLRFCFQRFEVGLWSGAMERNIDGVLSTFPYDLRGRFAFVWDQNQCKNSGFMSLIKKEKPIFLKELKKIWDNEGDSIHRWPKGTYSASNTLLIETEPCKALLNPPNTAIFLDGYKVSQAQDAVLGSNGDLRTFLSGLEKADNVHSYVEKNPLGQQAISPLHPNWDYYKRIFNKFNEP